MKTPDEWTMLEDVLALATHDWLTVRDVSQTPLRLGIKDPDDRRVVGLGLLASLLLDDLMVAGDVDKTFQPWPITPLEAFGKIAAQWLQADRGSNFTPDIGDWAWLDLTEKGDRLASEVVAQTRYE